MISKELKRKLVKELPLFLTIEQSYSEINTFGGIKMRIPLHPDISAKIKFDENELDIFLEVTNMLKNNFTFKIDINRFKGIYISEIDYPYVLFNIDYLDEETWRDWFIIE